MNHQTEEAKYHDDYNNNDHSGSYPTDTHYPEDGNYHYDDAANTYHDGDETYHGNTTAAGGMDCKDYCDMESSYMRFSSEDAAKEFMKECNTQCKKDS